MKDCTAAGPARTVYDCMQAALRRSHEVLPGMTAGELVKGQDGLSALFFAGLKNGRITSLDYRCSTCATLVAVCERISQMVLGMEAANALMLRPEDVLASVAGIPAMRSDRVRLALAAMRSALY